MASQPSQSDDYTSWSREKLIAYVSDLKQKQSATKKKERRPPRPFDPSKYSTRLVAFKLAYLGKNYNGFEFHANNPTPRPTIEEELWKAFNKAKLIFPSKGQAIGDWEGCEYSKCGRTDKGVSAFGQVIGLRVRSNRPLGKRKKTQKAQGIERGESGELVTDDLMSNIQTNQTVGSNSFDTTPRESAVELAAMPLLCSPTRSRIKIVDEDPDNSFEHDLNFDPIADEIPYASILNRLLPHDIRILAWCPAPPLDFSARFSCSERQYRYFFTQPCFPPIPHGIDPLYTPSSTTKDGYLDIDSMRTAAKLYEGLHDFRNLCKVDPSKQLENFERRIFHADIEEVPDVTSTLKFFNSPDFKPLGYVDGFPKVYAFTLHGSAFLWHQVRHMVAILFLVGQGLEEPSIVTKLMDVTQNPRRPTYEMAAETPLVLWDCVFAHKIDSERKEALQWIYVGDTPGTAHMKYGVPAGGLMDDLWRIWRERKIDEVLAAGLLGLVFAQGEEVKSLKARQNNRGKSQRVFDGGDAPRLHGKYTQVMRKPVMDTVDVINERYAIRKGFENAADLKEQGFRRLNLLGSDEIVKKD
ncbi:hypothetical protein K3495_g9238 [Podosphaera aphanis]|nr:hypothetical protein K3495_g9238 [Podosphaera aphanis]